MDSEFRNRKHTPEDPEESSAGGLSTANKHHHLLPSASSLSSVSAYDSTSHVYTDGETPGNTQQKSTAFPRGREHARVMSEELTIFPSGHTLTDIQKESLAKESVETAYGKTPNGTSKSLLTLVSVRLSVQMPCVAVICGVQKNFWGMLVAMS